jgi:hypothetical protein
MFRRSINEKTSICYHKKTEAPKRKSAQEAAVRPKCRKLVSIFRKKIVIIDYESYFYLNIIELSANVGYYSSDPDATPNEVKLKRKGKLEPKLLVWIAISEKALNRAFGSSNQRGCVYHKMSH